MIKLDCFALNRRKLPFECSVLTEMVCMYKDSCSFYKTKEQYEQGLIKAHGTKDMKKIMQQNKERKDGI